MSSADVHPAPRGLDLLYGVLFRPRETFRQADLERAAGTAALVVALVALVDALVGSAASGGMLVLSFFTWLGFLLLGWLVLTGLLFVITRILRPQGEFGELFAAIGLSMMPWLLEAPLSVVARWGAAGTAVAAVGSVAVFIWWVRILIAGIRGATGLSAPQSLTALVVADLVLIGLPLALFVLMIMGLVVLASA